MLGGGVRPPPLTPKEQREAAARWEASISRSVRKKGRAKSDLDTSIPLAVEQEAFVPKEPLYWTGNTLANQRRRRRNLVDQLDLVLVDPRASRIAARGKVIKGPDMPVGEFIFGKGHYFEDAPLGEVDFTGATIVQANADGSDFRNAKLSGADLRGSRFNWANFEGANLSGAKLGYTMWQGANLQGANLRDADFEESDLRGAWFNEETDVSGADFRTALLEQSTIGVAKNVERAKWSSESMPPDVRRRLEMYKVPERPTDVEVKLSPEMQDAIKDLSPEALAYMQNQGLRLPAENADIADVSLVNDDPATPIEIEDISVSIDDSTPIDTGGEDNATEDSARKPRPPASNYRPSDIKSSAPKPQKPRKSRRHPFWSRGESKRR